MSNSSHSQKKNDPALTLWAMSGQDTRFVWWDAWKGTVWLGVFSGMKEEARAKAVKAHPSAKGSVRMTRVKK